MTDSIRLVNDSYTKRIHCSKPVGKLHRGHNVAAATASIPSKFQTIVIDNSEKKGFSSRSQRFGHHATSNENPGPGHYIGHYTIESQSTSFSKRGTGGFASKDRRMQKQQYGYSPGPGVYDLPSQLVSQRDHNKAGTTSAFHKPIAQNKTLSAGNPAPNEYRVHHSKIGKVNNVTADAAFKSRTKREVINVGDARSKPSPWHYTIKDEVTRQTIKVPLSSFKSKTERKMHDQPTDVPGPGTYHPSEPIPPIARTVFPRKHYLCISAPAMPLPETPPMPGPGSYELTTYDGDPKHYMSSAAFVSTTSRWTGGDVGEKNEPGPAHYKPAGSARHSFIYNAAGRWI